MNFQERQATETLAAHLLRNADSLGLDTGQVSRVRLAYRLSNGTNAERTEGGRIAVEVRSEVEGAVLGAEVAATARGERVLRFNDAGARRVRERDGLGALMDRGSITQAEFQTGMAYRLLYEHGAGYSIGSQLADKVRAPAASSDATVAAGLLRAYAGIRLTGCDRAVSVADATGRALRLLRAIAGEGRSLRSLGDGGNVKVANLEALHVGLTAARAALEANGGLRIGAR